MITVFYVNGQITDSLHLKKTLTDSIYPQKDLGDLISKWFGHPPKKQINPAEINKQKTYISVFPAVGYTLQTKLAAILAGNIAFYISPYNTNLSAITSSIAYTQNKQFTLPVQYNIWTKNNHYNFQGDWRYYKYPQETFGLGSDNSFKNDGNLIDYSYLRFYNVALKSIAKNVYGGIGYFLDYHWNISEAGYTDGRVSDFNLYGAEKQSTSSGIGINFLYDSRTNPVNPSGGAYANILYRSNIKKLGSNSNWQSLLIDARKYFPLSAHSIIGIWSYNWLILSGKPPYLDLPSTAWDTYTNTGRGFIQGRFRSNYMLYLESEYRFQLTNNGLLGGIVFANTQAFVDWQTNRFNKLQPAAGAGLRIKLNKYSKTNLDIDYGIGAGGSRGLFINIGEVF
ncbi:MAG: hypothetical protein ACM3H8_13295 [Sphingobacteriales bacterium]